MLKNDFRQCELAAQSIHHNEGVQKHEVDRLREATITFQRNAKLPEGAALARFCGPSLDSMAGVVPKGESLWPPWTSLSDLHHCVDARQY